MTDQEKKLQRVQLQVDLEDAQSDLAHLKEKAIRMQQNASDISDKLLYNIGLEPSGEDSGDGDAAQSARDRSRLNHDNDLNPVDVTKLIEELRVARQKVYNLHQRKRRLANPSGLSIAS